MEEKIIPITWLTGQYSYTAIISKEILKTFGFGEINDVLVEVGPSELLIKINDQKKSMDV